MNKVALLFGIHCHQPEGNFDEVIADACDRSYFPFLEVANEYKDFHFSVHYSGGLLDWIETHRPELSSLLKDMVKRGQVEIIGAGDHEPVLAVIPSNDRVGQINALSDRCERMFSARPKGAWLTERVWEATVVPSLQQANMGFVMVDDYHFFCAGYEQQQLGGYYRTEEDSHVVDIFPISEALRYRLPFSPADSAVSYIESLAHDTGMHAAICFDDGEKFGIWPETYEWVYEKGWLHQFIQGVLASDVIEAMTFSAYHQQYAAKGLCYLPTTSYSEMGEWSLPPVPCSRYEALMQQQREQGQFDENKAFIRGGIWKNFLVKYPESGWMHKRVVGLSQRLSSLAEQQQTAELRNYLYRAQANDAFWHGMFGGLYHPHLRRALYHNMLKLESALDALEKRPSVERYDLDFDGRNETLLHNEQQQIIVQAHQGGMIREWDSYVLAQNFGDVLRRHPEAYHEQIRQGEAQQHDGDGIASIHDRIAFIHQIYPGDLEIDRQPRGIACDFIAINGVAQEENPEYLPRPEKASHDRISLTRQLPGALLTKSYQLQGSELTVFYRFEAQVDTHICLKSQWNLAMPSCDGPAGCYLIDAEVLGGFGEASLQTDNHSIGLRDHVLGGEVHLQWSQAARLALCPLRTVSRSESGFEKIMQAAVLEPEWEQSMSAGSCWELIIKAELRQS